MVNVAGAVPGTPVGFETVLASTAGDLEIAVVGFTAAEAEVTLFGSATGAFGLSSSSLKRFPKAPMKPPSFSITLIPPSMALIVLSAALRGTGGVAAA